MRDTFENLVHVAFSGWHRLFAAPASLRSGPYPEPLSLLPHTGIVEAYWEYELKPWDTCAGVVVLTEAGGRVTTLEGGEYR